MFIRTGALAIILPVVLAAVAVANEPQWWGVVVARGEAKAQIEATPILDRPYRPLHFYGNAVRREYFRGSPLPLPRDVVNGAAALVVRRRPAMLEQ